MNRDEHTCCSHGLLAAQRLAQATMTRRGLMAGMSSAAIAGWAAAAQAAEARGATEKDSEPRIAPASELVVQPALTYALHQRREQTSWRPWGGLMDKAQVAEEVERIQKELADLVTAAKLPVRVLPVAAVQTPEEAAKVGASACDVMLIYASGGGENLITALMNPGVNPGAREPAKAPARPTLFFLRHRSGPVSLYYEILHPRFMRKGTDQYKEPAITVQDVVVDNADELAWRLRALAGLRRTLGQRIVAIGGAGGWGDGHNLAPKIACEKWHLEIIDEPYEDLGKRIENLRQDASAVEKAKRQAAEYLAQPGVTLKTQPEYVENAFMLCRVFKDLMKENNAGAMTIQHCMGTVMPISKTTACLPLSLINDEGLLAFCESDFVVIPAGILMHHITGRPVFLNDPTWPHDGIVTIAHCTAPRRMNGKDYEPVEIHTHFESDYGASPKVAMREGQLTTNVVPDFGAKKFVGFVGKVVANPFHPICRSQTDITVEGDLPRLVEDMRGFHWMTCYGDCRREVAYALKHVGIEWEDVSASVKTGSQNV